MQEFPQALPAVQILQHASELAGVTPKACSGEIRMSGNPESGELPKLAVAVASSKPITDAKILNAVVIVPSLGGALRDTASVPGFDMPRPLGPQRSGTAVATPVESRL